MTPNAAAIFAILPSGDYKAVFTFWVGDAFLREASAIAFLNTSVKDTFG